VLEVKDVTVHYDKALALDHVSLNVEENEIVAVLGANGAGKSTLLRTISGLVRGTGEIRFGQARLDVLHRHEIVKAGVVHCPEGRRLFPEMTVLDNLLLGAYLRQGHRQIDEDREKVYALFPVLKERSRQVASTLSGGEQQMAAIGRALMSNPKLLMLDEPSLGLAPLAQEAIFRGIKEIAKSGMSVLLVEQNARQALTIAHRAYVLEVGRVALSGMSQDLVTDPHVREAYLAP
jgi:branched-chain amino acid transport system ATP-binding protein